MEINKMVFDGLKTFLTEWKPKGTTPDKGGEGFNEHNVVNVEGTLPTGIPFDYVYFGFPAKAESPVTTGSGKVQISTRTYTVDMYCKRAGTGAIMKQNTRAACDENTAKIVEYFAQNGFSVTMPIPDLNFSGNNTARQPMYFTRTFRS
jgi:hypothetical protein